MNRNRIIIGVIIIITIYLLYLYFQDSSDTTLVSTHDARKLKVVSGSNLPNGASIDYTYSIWFYVNDWNYRFGETKVIYGRTDQNNDPAPSVTLAPSTNNLTVTLATYPTSGSNANPPTMHSCTVENVPLQKWTNLIISLNNRALDMYLDGKLVRTCVLPGVPKANPDANVLLTPSGGFSGKIASFRYISKAINPTEAYNIYKQGYGSGLLGGLFDRYKIKIGFMKDNEEINSIQL